ncbi:hypothetical protein J4E81_010359 [Alternaria sp. BMP 2799]|nr:hypothetical protein J4E81_010359 [Alternaria sp. BMP 2799]
MGWHCPRRCLPQYQKPTRRFFRRMLISKTETVRARSLSNPRLLPRRPRRRESASGWGPSTHPSHSSDVHNDDHTEPEPRADDYAKFVCASRLYNNMPFRQKVIKDTYIFLRQMRPDLVPWTASIWDTNAARDGTVFGGCMFAQVDPAKAYKLEKLVEPRDSSGV